MDVIYCAGGGTRLAQIAIGEGFLYGARSDDIRKIRCNGIIDINWKKYDWRRHVSLVAAHKPRYAVAPDILDVRALPRSIRLAQQLRDCGSQVIVVPKVSRLIRHIPGGYIVGISVPTPYGGFLPAISELVGRKVHLLGGSPKQQRELWMYYTLMGIRVTGVDTNSHGKASDYGSYWNGSQWCDNERKNLGKYEAFRKSCRGIMKMWKRLGAID